MSGRAALSLLHSQLLVNLPIPSTSFTDQTIIVTGANTGLGREAAKHFLRLNAAKVILAVRTVSKGEAALQYLEKITGRKGIAEIWQVDLSSYESVKAFTRRAQGLERLDAVVENAGIWQREWQVLEGEEATITVNVISTYLMALNLLPKMRKTAMDFGVVPRITIVTSALHKFAQLPARKQPKIFDALKKRFDEVSELDARYHDSKILVVLYGQELAAAITASGKPTVTLNYVNPGYCVSELIRAPTMGSKIGEKLLARSTDVGARTLVDAVIVGKGERHGKYVDDMKIGRRAAFLDSKEGKETGKRVWRELNEKLEAIHPGVLLNI